MYHVIQVGGSQLLPLRLRSTYKTRLDIQERGGEATVEVLSLVHDMSDPQGKHSKHSSSSGFHDPFSSVSRRA